MPAPDDVPRSSDAVPSSVPRPEGLVLASFSALRYDAACAGDLSRLTSPPYDVIDADGVAELEAASEHNVVRLILPRDAGNGPYERAAATLAGWRASGVLRPDPQPGLYVYEQATPDGHVQRGLLGALALTGPEDGIVLPHENTMAGPVSDRLALYEAVGADLEPIFLVYEGGGAASQVVGSAEATSPLVDVDLPDGLRHRLWQVTEGLEDVASDLAGRVAVIADGHHRYATYLARQARRHAAGAGPGPWDAGLAFLVDSTAFGPQVHPIHRVLPGRQAADLAEAARSGMTVTGLPSRDLAGALARLAQTDGPAYVLADGDGDRLWLLSDPSPAGLAGALPAERSGAWRSLDVSVLHGYVVPALWGMDDTEETVGYQHGEREAVREAGRSGGSAVLLRPTPVGAVTAVAANGERMPRKSTLFTPKPRTGLVIRTLDR